MQVRQCDFCRMPYQSYGNKICKDCLMQIDLDFFKVRDYLYEHEGAGIEEVADATGVSRKAIIYMLKEERLSVTDSNGGSGGYLTCESCKKPINSGRMCAGCKTEVLKALQPNAPAVKPKPAPAPEQEEVSIKGMAKLQLQGRKGR